MHVRSALTIGLISAGAMVAAIAYGMASGGFTDEFRAVLELPWGRVTLVDLASGLLLIGAWIGWRERSIARAAPWWVAMVLTGNLAAAVYVVNAARSANSVGEVLTGTNA